MKFPFNEQENLAVITCKHILEGVSDICYVTHDEEDDGWQFLCDLDSHIESDARVISLKEVFNFDNSIAELADMPVGYGAMRKDKNSSWQSFRK